jgi:hypothetical protein
MQSKAIWATFQSFYLKPKRWRPVGVACGPMNRLNRKRTKSNCARRHSNGFGKAVTRNAAPAARPERCSESALFHHRPAIRRAQCRTGLPRPFEKTRPNAGRCVILPTRTGCLLPKKAGKSRKRNTQDIAKHKKQHPASRKERAGCCHETKKRVENP